MKVIGDICAPTGQYTTNDGQEKTRWAKCGVLMQKDTGEYRVKLDVVPIGGEGWLAVFEKDNKPKQQPVAQPTVVGEQQDVPF